MSRPLPIVESTTGQLSFLYPPESPDGDLHVRWREGEFPSIANMQTVLGVHRRADADEMDPYGLVRVANNLAAAHICSDDHAVAFELLSEAEAALVRLIQDAPRRDSRLAVSFAVLKFNACVALERTGDVENRESAALNRQYANQALEQVAEGSENHQARFVAVALSRLGE